MHKSESVDYSELRKEVSKLFIAVLTKRMPVREALLRFPKSCDDPTLLACRHALCYFEADEELRLKDKLYEEEQNNYINFIAYTLSEGGQLPENIIKEYGACDNAPLKSEKSDIRGIIRKLKRFICC